MSALGSGLLAGAAGTVAIDIATYIDMARSNRPASELPSNVVAAIARRLGATSLADAPENAHRRTALGALVGYGNGLALGALHGLLHPVMKKLPWPIEGVLLGVASSAASDVPAARLGVTDPSSWSPTDWASDLGFHIVYGLVTAGTLRALKP